MGGYRGPSPEIRDWGTSIAVSVESYKQLALKRAQREREAFKRLDEERAAHGMYNLPAQRQPTLTPTTPQHAPSSSAVLPANTSIPPRRYACG